MFGVKIRVIRVKESIYVGFKSIHIIKIQNGSHICQEVPPNFDYESLKNSNSVKIRSIMAEESKYEFLIPL